MSSKLQVERRGAVAVLELARPEVLNALDGELCESLLAAVRDLERDDDIRVLVLCGRGERAFCAGADLKHMRGLSGPALRRFIERTWEPLEALALSPLVSIAALHGHVLGGGAELALACDVRVAAPDMRFGFPEMVLGSLPGSSGMQRLPEIVGRAKALELVALGTRLDGDAALGLGLVSRLAEPGASVRETALELAASFAERPAESLRYAKVAMRMAGRPDLAAAFHGLVSSVRQADPDYRGRTEAIQNGRLREGSR